MRAQLTCATYRQDVYFAVDNKRNKRVVVKGPYDPTKNKHKFAYNLNQIKKYLTGINQIDMEVAELKPDLWITVPLGLRNKLNSNKKAFFIVMEDLCHQQIPLTSQLPSIKKGSKIWPSDTLVYQASDHCTFLDIIKLHSGIPSITANELEKMRIHAILAYMFRYIFEITDTCDRNFLINWIEQKIYSIDEDNFGVGQRKYLTGNRPVPNKGNQNTILINWLIQYKHKLINHLEDWKASLQNNQGDIKTLLVELGVTNVLSVMYSHIDYIIAQLKTDPKNLLRL